MIRPRMILQKKEPKISYKVAEFRALAHVVSHMGQMLTDTDNLCGHGTMLHVINVYRLGKRMMDKKTAGKETIKFTYKVEEAISLTFMMPMGVGPNVDDPWLQAIISDTLDQLNQYLS